ncbi:MAG: tetratricopeptide repeat protein [Chloroflexi bacterium]|nr:tetratricopeptide repeat protein [Chloroflexota bacterium]MBU1748457.1 tetratricopeptide repeat protein [Chloroflexota bacterium]
MTKSPAEQIADLKTAIAAQDGLRAMLGDAVVDTTIAALRRQMAELEAQVAAPPPAAGIGGGEQQRKQATVLLADVSGFTTLSEAMDAEDVSDMMNVLWQRIDAVIVEHGGLIDKHIGDAVMALWGAELSREDDPERAVLAALAMQADLVEFRDGYRVPLTMRIGVSTGPVLLGGVGTTGEFSAIGDAVNLTERLEHLAPVGGVLISHDTYRHVRGLFDVQPLSPVRVKGKSEPIQAYEVQRARPRASLWGMGTRGVEGIETRMVGRDAEMLALQNLYLDAVENTETHVVTIVGDAGVGKSRLLFEFEHWLEALPDPVRYFKGRAAPAMQHIPYGIIRDMFANRFDIRESDNAATVLAKFRAGMSGILEQDQADLVGHLVGFDFREAGSQVVGDLLGSPSFGRLATAYLTKYVQTAASEPTALMLEDIHWADKRSLDLIDHLSAEVPHTRLLIVCLARPGLFEWHPDWGQGETSVRLELAPLCEDDSRTLVDEILRQVNQVPDDLSDLVVRGAEGNPYYVEELIKMLVEDGVIVRGKDKADPWHVELNRLTSVRVPATLTGVLQARLDSLPHEEKEVLQRASVVGRLFWDAAVAALAIDEARPDQSAPVTVLLDALQGRELVFQRAQSAFEAANEYIFKHAILRDVTYETVLLKLRRTYHVQVARWLEANAGKRLGEYLSLIAGHYELAGEPVPAAAYRQRSGDELYRVCAYYDAIVAFERALALLPENEMGARAALLVRLGRAYRQISDYPLAAQHFADALALARDPLVGDVTIEVAGLNGLGWTAMGPGDYDEAARFLTQALARAREVDDREGLAEILCNLGEGAFRQGESAAAERYAQESLAIYRELGDRQGMAFALRVVGFSAYMRGEYEKTERHHRESQAIYREIGDRWGVGAGFTNLGETARMQGHYEEAARHYEASLQINREIGARRSIAVGLLNLGHAHVGMGQDQTAWASLREALREASPIGAMSIVVEALAAVSLLQARAGQPKRAAELLGLVQSHPACNKEVMMNVEPVLVVLREALPANELESVLARGALLDLETVVAGLVAGAG